MDRGVWVWTGVRVCVCEAAVCPASLTVCVLTDWPHPEQPAAVQEQHPQQEGGRAAEDGRAAAELPHAAQLQRCVCSPLPEPGSRAPPRCLLAAIHSFLSHFVEMQQENF